MAAHHRICRSTASQSPVLTCGGISVLPTITYLMYPVSGSTLTAVRRSQSLARWPGSQSRILSKIHRAVQTVLGVYFKCTCSCITSASSALPSPTQCFFPGLKPSSLQIFPTVALPFFLLKYLPHGFPGLFTVISGHICFLLSVFSVFTLFSCRFRAVD